MVLKTAVSAFRSSFLVKQLICLGISGGFLNDNLFLSKSTKKKIIFCDARSIIEIKKYII